MTRLHIQISASLVLACAVGAQAAPSAGAEAFTRAPDSMVSSVAVVKHTRKTVTRKTVTRRTVHHHKSTARGQSSNATSTATK